MSNGQRSLYERVFASPDLSRRLRSAVSGFTRQDSYDFIAISAQRYEPEIPKDWACAKIAIASAHQWRIGKKTAREVFDDSTPFHLQWQELGFSPIGRDHGAFAMLGVLACWWACDTAWYPHVTDDLSAREFIGDVHGAVCCDYQNLSRTTTTKIKRQLLLDAKIVSSMQDAPDKKPDGRFGPKDRKKSATSTSQLIDWIRGRGGAVTVRDVQKNRRRQYPTAKAALAALEDLVLAGLAEWAPTEGGRGFVFTLTENADEIEAELPTP